MLDKSLTSDVIINLEIFKSNATLFFRSRQTIYLVKQVKLTFWIYTRGCIEYSDNTAFTSSCSGARSAGQGGGKKH